LRLKGSVTHGRAVTHDEKIDSINGKACLKQRENHSMKRPVSTILASHLSDPAGYREMGEVVHLDLFNLLSRCYAFG
jgi:hypothetical protein